ncbi:non-ribosomal peptide synthetase [Nocardia sp. MW-W600-9]
MHNGDAKYDLTLELTETPHGLTATIEYRTDLYDTARIQRLTSHYTTLLHNATTNPDQPITQLTLLTPREQHQLLHTWNTTHHPHNPTHTITDLITRQTHTTPHIIAATDGIHHLTYHQLHTTTNHLANTLTTHNIKPDTIIGLLARRSIDYLVAIVAILKAGGAFLPLDPMKSADHLRAMVDHSGCAMVLVDDEFLATATEATASSVNQPRIACLRELLESSASNVRRDPPQIHIGGHNLAYVLYTSGSTGAPKGVMIEHGGMLNHILGKIDDLGMTGADVVAQNGPQCFDVSVWQFLAPLILGGRTEVIDDDTAADPSALIHAVARREVTILQVVPSMMTEIVHEVSSTPPALSALRWIVPTGDALPVALCRRWFDLFPAIPILNTYGSTECSDDQCHYLVESAEDTAEPITAIGTPIRNMRAYVLDAHLVPTPVGVPGELYIGGLGVGRGYLSDPVRTASTFIPDPFSGARGTRMYRTADQGYRRADGTLVFQSRRDHVVKIRGFRIEPAEVEVVLLAHPSVKDAVVVAASDGKGHKRLVAYCVYGDARQENPPGLREFVREQLPDYMVPSVFAPMPALPLNSNGKVDRKALPAISAATADLSFQPLETSLERAVAEVWSEVLGVADIGADAGFFDLGGHSLLASRVISRLSRNLAVEIPLSTLFDNDTVAEFARAIDRLLGRDHDLPELLRQVETLDDEQILWLLRQNDVMPEFRAEGGGL